jgi:leucyl aminopeptidase
MPYRSDAVIEFEAVRADVTSVEADLLVLPCFSGCEPGPGTAQAARALGIDLAGTLGRHGFSGDIGDAFTTLTLGRIRAGAVMLVGVGDRAQAGPAAVRQATMQAASQMNWAARIATTLPAAGLAAAGLPEAVAPAAPAEAADGEQACAAAFSEGLLLGAYQYDRYRRDPATPGWRRPAIERVEVLAASQDTQPAAAGLRRGQDLADLTNWVRDLVNASSSDKTPAVMADQARELAGRYGLPCQVLGVPELVAGGFGGILGVGKGSANEPRLVEIAYRGGGDAPVIGMTGKGITFDSGGLTLKRTAEIEYMKSDMAGAATIMAVLRGAAERQLPVNIDAVLPFAENMPSGSAQRPGDILTHRGGKTSEIRDTDNEGRVLVADGLAYLAERGPSLLIDVATLTDAAGLGESLWAVLGSADEQIAELIAAGREAGDPGWHLPLPAQYRRHLASEFADVRNQPALVPDTTVLASMYLGEFTGGLPWMHIDNGSTAYLEQPADGWPEGATGSPVRALLAWTERWAQQH